MKIILSSFVMKSISKPQHQVIRIFKFAQLISHMQKQMSGDLGFESQNLVKPFCIIPTAYQISPNTCID